MVHVSSMKTRRLTSNAGWRRFHHLRRGAMSGQFCSVANTVFIEADALALQEAPVRVARYDDFAVSQFGKQGMQPEIRLFGQPREQPVTLRLQKKRPAAAHRHRRSAPCRPRALRPLHDTRHADVQHVGHGPARLARSSHDVIFGDTNWIAMVAPVINVAAAPVFVDVLCDTRCLDLDRVEAAIAPRTKAIIANYCNLCDLDRLQAVSSRHGILSSRCRGGDRFDLARPCDGAHRWNAPRWKVWLPMASWQRIATQAFGRQWIRCETRLCSSNSGREAQRLGKCGSDDNRFHK